MSLASQYLCHTFKKGDDARDAGLSTPDSILRHDDIAYGDDPFQVLDVYRPKESEGPLPVILSVHGGGWVYGDKERYQFYCMDLARRGFAVVNFTYRLAPKYKYPAQIEDVDLVCKWMQRNAETRGLDLTRLFGVGDSAGGRLLSVYCALLANAAFRECFPFTPPEDLRFRAVALNCGVYRQEKPKKKDLLGSLLDDLLPKGWSEKDLYPLNSYDKITPGFPPSFVMTSTEDFLKDQVSFLLPELEKNGVEHELHIYGSAEEPRGHVFHLNIRDHIATECNDAECAYFRRFF